jgi:hypothetical protein
MLQTTLNWEIANKELSKMQTMCTERRFIYRLRAKARAGGLAQAVDSLPSKIEALSSNPSMEGGREEGRKEGKKEGKKERRKEGRIRNC